MRVMDLMTKKPATCKISDSLSVAARLMWDGDCGAIPVVDDGGAVKGMITDRDICMACFTQAKPPSNVSVQEAMSHSLFSCLPESNLADAERTMRLNKVRRLPVVDRRGSLIGILSLADIARVAPQELMSILGDICQPRQAVESRTH
jgi:CBS domain-containing protein